jgi:hypothetical protein
MIPPEVQKLWDEGVAEKSLGKLWAAKVRLQAAYPAALPVPDKLNEDIARMRQLEVGS